MGTDIHTCFQKQNGRVWEDIVHNYEEGRQYSLFAWLGGVRNGSGFAGVPTHNPITPLQKCRGYPDGFEVDDDRHPVTSRELLGWRLEYRDESDPLEIWMGDHSHGWLHLDEILSTQPPTIMRTGVIGIDYYKELGPDQVPTSWSGDVWGAGIKIDLPEEIDEETTHIRVSWLANLLVDFAPFLNECKRLKELHGSVRMVFGFDS